MVRQILVPLYLLLTAVLQKFSEKLMTNLYVSKEMKQLESKRRRFSVAVKGDLSTAKSGACTLVSTNRLSCGKIGTPHLPLNHHHPTKHVDHVDCVCRICPDLLQNIYFCQTHHILGEIRDMMSTKSAYRTPKKNLISQKAKPSSRQ